mgnify:CR=1 FL=1
MALNIKDDNFEAILAEGKPVVLDFWAYDGVDHASRLLRILKNWPKNTKDQVKYWQV